MRSLLSEHPFCTRRQLRLHDRSQNRPCKVKKKPRVRHCRPLRSKTGPETPQRGGEGGGKSKGKTMGDCHRPTTSSKATSGQPKKTPDCLQVPSWVPESGLDLNPAPWPFNRVQGS